MVGCSSEAKWKKHKMTRESIAKKCDLLCLCKITVPDDFVACIITSTSEGGTFISFVTFLFLWYTTKHSFVIKIFYVYQFLLYLFPP